MNQMQYNEYEMLRKENMDYLDKKEEIRKFVITATIAILTLASSEIWRDDEILYLIPEVIITLSMVKTISMERRTREIIAYRIVFLENGCNDICWARATMKYSQYYDKKEKKNKKISTIIGQFDYAILSFLCVLIYYSKFGDDITNLLKSGKFFRIEIVILVIILIIFSYILYLSKSRKKANSPEEFAKYIDRWKNIKSKDLNF